MIGSLALSILMAYDLCGWLFCDPTHNGEISPSQKRWLTFPSRCLSIEFLGLTVSCLQMPLAFPFVAEPRLNLRSMHPPVTQ